ncbi:MAG: hypothetical protein C0616_02810 [Desulfuromonas sp.]|nr:MAG: hypothetical protein C0616_02810 [Desulfuromonas sp.]
MIKPRIIKASLISPLMTLLPLALLAAAVIVAELLEIHLAEVSGYASARAAGLILFVLVPVAYPVLVLVMALAGYLLRQFNLLTRTSLFIGAGLVSLVLGIGLGWSSPHRLRDQLIGVGIFVPLTFISLCLGSYVWWQIATPKE